jgi:hypothetical protein
MTMNIVSLDARAVRASAGVVAKVGQVVSFAAGLPVAGDASVLDRIVAILDRSPAWPELP